MAASVGSITHTGVNQPACMSVCVGLSIDAVKGKWPEMPFNTKVSTDTVHGRP